LNREYEDYLRGKERGFLATLGVKGPTIVPVCFAYESDTVYTAIDKKPKRGKGLARVANIEMNPRAAFVVDTYSDDWRRLSYLLIHGSASLVRGRPQRERARGLLLSKYPQYRWLGLNGSRIIALRVERVKLWRFQS